jgi:phage/plasmid-like protein (TIGR03299 family)
MAHMIDMSNGRANVMVVGQPAWHRLGVNVQEAPTSERAMELAGLNWGVSREPVYIRHNGGIVEVPDRKAIVRSDTGLVLGVHSNNYRPLQNREAFDFLDALVAEGQVKYETAGSLKDGRVIWALARIPTTIEAAEGDVTLPYVLISNSHDGSQAVRIYPTAIRVVCNNTLRLSESSNGSALGLSLLHMGDMGKKVEEARQTLGLIRKSFKDYGQQVRGLVKRKLTDREARNYFGRVLPMPSEATDKVKDNVTERRNRLATLYFDEPANNLAGIRRTAWAAVNAVTHHVDHELRTIGKTDTQKLANRLNSMWFGDGDRLKRHAFAEALALSN